MHKTNTLKNILQKSSLFFQKTTFVLKKVVSLHLVEKSSGFCYNLTLKSEKFQVDQEKIISLAVLRVILFGNGYFSEPQRRVVSPRF